MRLHLMLAAAVLTLTSVIDLAAAESSRVALVIGNSAYKSSSLVNPVNDATDMADALRECGFTVTKRTNVSRSQMRDAIREFGATLNPKTVGLFYYAGHAVQFDGENFLVPVGADAREADEVPDECVLVSSVLRKMISRGNHMNIIILDACRDNPYRSLWRSEARGLRKMDAPIGSIIAYATGPGSVAADGRGRNGIYTGSLLKHIATPGLSVEHLFKRVRRDVIAATGRQQVPWESSSLTGDFAFKGNGIVIETVADVPPAQITGLTQPTRPAVNTPSSSSTVVIETSLGSIRNLSTKVRQFLVSSKLLLSSVC